MIYISAVGMLSALGNDMATTAENLARNEAPGMRPDSGWLLHGKPCWTGRVDAALPDIPLALAAHRSRNNQLLLAALQQIQPQVSEAIETYGHDRVAIVLGTSTSGLNEADSQVAVCAEGYHYYQQELGDPSRFLASYLRLSGPAYTLSTACSSSARAIVSGKRLIECGLADVAIVGGADTLSRMPINGFDSLESLSAERCAPFSKQRSGISIGEGAALMLLTKTPHQVAVSGVGESSDAWHMSAPHPAGEGAIRAIEMALKQANLAAGALGYINLHGTATRLNDKIEAEVVSKIFGETIPCSSTKHLTGHTLGAAGICEAALCWLILTQSVALPPQDFTLSGQDDTLAACGLLLQARPLAGSAVMTNSFAFGGNNTCLILEKHDG